MHQYLIRPVDAPSYHVWADNKKQALEKAKARGHKKAQADRV